MFEWTYVVPVVTALLGLFLGHLLSKRREDEKRKRELRVEYLVEAYRKLERASQPTSGAYRSEDVESAVADIQLFGDKGQVKLAHDFCEAASCGDGSLLQDLLEDLRKELRKELNLDRIGLPPVRPFRISANKQIQATRKPRA